MTLTQSHIDEIKTYYHTQALTRAYPGQRKRKLDFLSMFDIVLAMRQPYFCTEKYLESNSMFYHELTKVRRAEGMIKRYFKMKANNRL